MIFNDSTQYTPLVYPLNWNVDYSDGTHYSEFNLETEESNDFHLINNDKVARFGLFGQIGKFYFDKDGSFRLNGKRVTIEYHKDDGEIIHLTNNFSNKDLITYKQACVNLNRKVRGEQKSNILSFNFGYKTIFTKNDLQIFFQPVMSFPIPSKENPDTTPYMEVKLTTNKDLQGDLVFKIRDIEVDRFNAPLEINYSGYINWNIK